MHVMVYAMSSSNLHSVGNLILAADIESEIDLKDKVQLKQL